MIHLRHDCLVFKTANGEQIPCSVQQVTVEFMGEAAAWVDEEIIQNAAQVVLHYFKAELGRTSVTVAEFSMALETALRGFGLNISASQTAETPLRVAETDLRQISSFAEQGCELVFFTSLRDAVRREFSKSPQVLRFSGLRGCVKTLTGARRWSPRCQTLSDQIVEYLRGCLSRESGGAPCALVVV